MTPMPNDEHQFLVKELTTILTIAVDWVGLGETRPGVNVSDRRDDWTNNFRCPDVAVFLNDTQAENQGAYWLGGPDLAIEIVSPGENPREKLPFYAKVKTRELLVVDRDPWTLSLFRQRDGKLPEVGLSTRQDARLLSSDTVPLSWQIIQVDTGSALQVRHDDQQQAWRILLRGE
jgi:Uma2 family endonuclease